MNRAQLRDEVYDRVGADSTDGSFPPAKINRAINSALHFIESDHDCPWLGVTTTLVTAAGTSAYSVPSDWSKTMSLRLPGYMSLERYDVDELDDLWPATASTGQPIQWGTWADQIELRPTPDAIYTLTHRYFKAEPELSTDTDTPLMPARFHTAIAEVATWLALRQDREDNRAVAALSAYEDRWRKLMADHINRFSGPSKVKIRVRY